MNFKKSESGRSMVEMLGVLAIIGVLSVGGIAGYSLSMRRHRANGIIDIAAKYALVNYGICQQKIMDGTISDVTSCNSMINFDDAGIGNKPAGVTGMYPVTFKTNAKTGTDTVPINIWFNHSDAKLCQAVASIAGSTCTGSSTGYVTPVNFNQN